MVSKRFGSRKTSLPSFVSASKHGASASFSARFDGVFEKKLPNSRGYSSTTSPNHRLLHHHRLLAILLAIGECMDGIHG
jgi:hypothetical protein